ncbi:peptide ABC transporter substrate-binding protein [uncultured Maricaulis sp.]|uniref:peptide ABC transporter substrate-binding protein n=1 Tax=uncultured Maricaulis sp. TaxID=174710 RepID=UPI0030D7530F|tara:strand:- start:2947 stop:4578 length:1632 start_codon:yes stop_codon:yes gene_type:complete
MRFNSTAAGLVTGLSLLLASCGGAPAGNNTTLNRGNRLEPLTLDPDLALISDERTIIADLFAGLYEPDAAGEPILGLASAATVSDDGLVWTFTLREGALWSDGTPITADDVVYGLQRPLDPATGNQYAAALLMIANAQEVFEGRAAVDTLGVSALDDRTVEVNLAYPAPYLPTVLMFYGVPVPRHTIEAFGERWVRPENMVTSGAYTLAQWHSNDFIHLVANPNFYDAAEICLTDIYYFPTVNTAAAERRVRSGELDLNVDFASSNTAFLTEHNPELVRSIPSLMMREIDFNASSPPFDNADVRRALSMAIDRRFLTGNVMGGTDVPAFRMMADAVHGALEGPRLDFADWPMERRRAEAVRLLEGAGFGPDNPLVFELAYQPAANWPRTIPVIQQDWMTLAPWVQVEVRVSDSQIHFESMRGGDFQVATSSWVPDFNDPYGVLMQYESRAGELNYTRWTDPQFDALTDAATRTPDVAEHSALLAQAEQLILDQSPVIPIFIEANRQLVSPRVTGWVPNATSTNQSRWLCLADPDADAQGAAVD